MIHTISMMKDKYLPSKTWSCHRCPLWPPLLNTVVWFYLRAVVGTWSVPKGAVLRALSPAWNGGSIVVWLVGFVRQALCGWATAPVQFALVIVRDGISVAICLGCSQIVILPISASQVDRIADMSHHNQLEAMFFFFEMWGLAGPLGND
jgi:hypothetical protein